MFFLLLALAVVAEIAAAGAATAIGIEAVTATTLETIAAGGTTTALNVGIVEAGKSLVTND